LRSPLQPSTHNRLSITAGNPRIIPSIPEHDVLRWQSRFRREDYSREFGYAIFRVAVPYNMEIDDAIKLMRDVGQPIKQWEVSRAFKLSLKRHLDEAGLDLATPRMSVEVITPGAECKKDD
jgi:hypothetical protein